MAIDWNHTHAAVWRPAKMQLRAIHAIDPISLASLIAIDTQKQAIVTNTERFIASQPANNVLLWGARGTGKSSLIKAVFNEFRASGLRLIEIFKHDLPQLLEIVDDIRELPYKFIVYCDDFSFEENDSSFRVLKTVLDGSIELPPDNVILYVTSNRRHLMPELKKDNLDTLIVAGELHYSDAVEDTLSLADRFGLSLSFYSPNFDGYLEIVDSYFPELNESRAKLHQAAKDFSISRASKSGRTAKQFYNFYSKP